MKHPVILALLVVVLVTGAVGAAVVGGTMLPSDGRDSERTDGGGAAGSERFAGTTFKGPVVVAVGDIACDPDLPVPDEASCREDETAALAKWYRPRLVLGLGDMQYQRGSYEDFMLSYDKTWGALKTITRPVPGNHAYRVRGAKGYFRYFRGQQPGSPGYYTFTVGSWRVYALNTNCGEISCSRERDWLGRHMRNQPRRCTLMTMHHPRFSSGGEHGSSRVPTRFWNTAIRHRAELALAGHDHNYERFRVMNADGRITRTGIQSFVSGAGGKSLHEFGEVERGSVVRDSSAPGVLALKLGKGRYAWEYRTVDGTLVDSGSRSCR